MLKLRAELILAKDGTPKSHDGDGENFRIRLFVEGAPPDVYAVTYELHESYYDPVQEVTERPSYPLEITSYGEYTVKATIRGRNGRRALAESLVRMLKDSHGKTADSEVKKALQSLSEN